MELSRFIGENLVRKSDVCMEVASVFSQFDVKLQPVRVKASGGKGGGNSRDSSR